MMSRREFFSGTGAPPPLSFTTPGITGVRRVTFEEDSLFIEARDNLVGLFQPLEEIFWEEVEAVYAWTTPDWTGMTVMLVLMVPILLIAALGFSAALPAPWPGLLTLLLGVVLVAVILFLNIRIVPRRHVRVVGAGREVRFHTTEASVTRSLLLRFGIAPEAL
jgi:hypothetical protein